MARTPGVLTQTAALKREAEGVSVALGVRPSPPRPPSSQAWSAAADALAYLAGLHLVCHDPRHDDSLVQGVEQSFHKVVLLLLGRVLELVTDLLQAPYGLKPQLDVLLGGNDADLGGDQEAQGPTRPGHSVEQV